jgi:hypothetical protein
VLSLFSLLILNRKKYKLKTSILSRDILIGFGKEIKRFGEKIEDFERKLIRKMVQNEDIIKSHATGIAGVDLKKEAKDMLPEIYRQIIEKKEKAAIPIIPDEAEIWIRKIYLDKSNEENLRIYINETLEKIIDEKEKIKAKIYLTKFYRKVVSAAALIKDEVMIVNESLSKLTERTLEEIKEIKEGKREEKLGRKIIAYAKKVIRYAIEVIIPSGGIKISENVSRYIKDMDFIQKAIFAFSVFAIEEALINYYFNLNKKKKLEKLYDEYDRKEQELRRKSTKIMNSIISSTIKDLEDIAKQIYGECKEKDGKQEEKQKEEVK